MTSCGFCHASRSGSSNTFAHFCASPKLCWWSCGVCACNGKAGPQLRASTSAAENICFMNQKLPQSRAPVSALGDKEANRRTGKWVDSPIFRDDSFEGSVMFLENRFEHEIHRIGRI